MEYLTSEQNLVDLLKGRLTKKEKVIWSGRCIQNSKRRFRIKRYSQTIIIVLATILIGGFSLIAFGANMKATDPSFFYLFFGFLSIWLLIVIFSTMRGIIMDMKEPNERFFVLTNKRAFSYENGKANSLLETLLNGAKPKMRIQDNGLGRIDIIGKNYSVNTKANNRLSYSSDTKYFKGGELEIDGIENPNGVYKLLTDAISLCTPNDDEESTMTKINPDMPFDTPSKSHLDMSNLTSLPTNKMPMRVKEAINKGESIYYIGEAKGIVSGKSFALSLVLYLIIAGVSFAVIIALILNSNINSTNFIFTIPVLLVGAITLIHIILTTAQRYGSTKRTYVITNRRVICIINSNSKINASMDIAPTMMKTAINDTTVFIGNETAYDLFNDGKFTSKTTVSTSAIGVDSMTLFGMPDLNEPYEVLQTLLDCI